MSSIETHRKSMPTRSHLPDSRLLSDLVDGIIFGVLDLHKAGDLREAQLNLFDILFDEWADQSKAFLGSETAAINGLVQRQNWSMVGGKVVMDPRAMTEFHALADGYLGADMAAGVREAATKFMNEMYAGTKALAAQEVKMKPTAFSLADKRALDTLNGDLLFWTRTAYSREVSNKINRTVQRTLAQGLTPREAGKALKAELGATLGGNWSQAYWDGVASAAAGRARTFGRINEYLLRNISSYEIVAVLDNKTTPICFPPWVRVLMGGGFELPIAEVRPGDFVIAGDGLPHRVEAISQRSSETWVELSFGKGGYLLVTSEHPFYTLNRGWVTAYDLREGEDVLAYQDLFELRNRISETTQERPGAQVLLTEMLPASQGKGSLGGESLRTLREGFSGEADLRGAGGRSLLFEKLQGKNKASGALTGDAGTDLHGLWGEVPSDGLRGLDGKEQEVLFEEMSERAAASQAVRELWRANGPDLVEHESTVLLLGLPPEVDERDVPRGSGSGSVGEDGAALRAGSGNGEVFGGFPAPGSGPVPGGGWGILARSGRIGEGGNDQDSGPVADPDSSRAPESRGAFPRSLPDYEACHRPVALTGKRLVHFVAPAFNLEVSGEPTYHADGFLVHNCQHMNGKVFEVTDAEQIVRETEGADTPDGVRSSHPWVVMDPARARAGKDALFVQRPGKAREYLQGSKVSQRPDGRWEAKGTMSVSGAKAISVTLPPYHWRCRSDVIVSQRATKDFIRAEKLREEYGVEKPMFTVSTPKGSGASVLSNAALIPAVIPNAKAVADEAWMASRFEELGLSKKSAATLSKNTAKLSNTDLLTQDLFEGLRSMEYAKRELYASGAAGDYNRIHKAMRLSGPNASTMLHEVAHHRVWVDGLLKVGSPLRGKMTKAYAATKERVLARVEQVLARTTDKAMRRELLAVRTKLRQGGIGPLGKESRRTLGKIGGTPSITNYSLENWEEHFAEGFAMYFKEPQRLQKRSPELFSVIREYLGQ